VVSPRRILLRCRLHIRAANRRAAQALNRHLSPVHVLQVSRFPNLRLNQAQSQAHNRLSCRRLNRLGYRVLSPCSLRPQIHRVNPHLNHQGFRLSSPLRTRQFNPAETHLDSHLSDHHCSPVLRRRCSHLHNLWRAPQVSPANNQLHCRRVSLRIVQAVNRLRSLLRVRLRSQALSRRLSPAPHLRHNRVHVRRVSPVLNLPHSPALIQARNRLITHRPNRLVFQVVNQFSIQLRSHLPSRQTSHPQVRARNPLCSRHRSPVVGPLVSRLSGRHRSPVHNHQTNHLLNPPRNQQVSLRPSLVLNPLRHHRTNRQVSLVCSPVPGPLRCHLVSLWAVLVRSPVLSPALVRARNRLLVLRSSPRCSRPRSHLRNPHRCRHNSRALNRQAAPLTSRLGSPALSLA